MTVETHFEATPDVALAGIGGVFDVAHFAILSRHGGQPQKWRKR